MKTHVNPILQHLKWYPHQVGLRHCLHRINISSSIVSYILIVALVTLVTLPFTFALTWRVIWENLGTILVTFVLPKILNFILMKLTKKCIFRPTFIKSRAGHPPIHQVHGVFGALLGDL
jgi:prepilin signal peptidase PulO-like enzyme (type II secretory pathway)